MKKKILMLTVAALLVVGMLPTLASAGGLNGKLKVDGEMVWAHEKGSGSGWSYADGVLTLDGVEGIDDISMVGSGTLTIQFNGFNSIKPSAGAAIYTNGVDLVLRGGGHLYLDSYGTPSMIPGEPKKASPALQVEDGKLAVDLSPGGYISLISLGLVDEAMGLEHMPAVWAANQGDEGYTASMDQITLGAGTSVVELLSDPDLTPPAKIGLYTWQEEVTEIVELAEVSSAEPTPATAKAQGENTIATVLGEDGTPLYWMKFVNDSEPGSDPGTTAGIVTPVKTPKTGDDSGLGIMTVIMLAGGAAAIGMARKKFN